MLLESSYRKKPNEPFGPPNNWSWVTLVTWLSISSASQCRQKTVHTHATSQTWWHQLPPLPTTAGGWCLCHHLSHAILAICAPRYLTGAGSPQTILQHFSGPFPLLWLPVRFCQWQALEETKSKEEGKRYLFVLSASGIISEVEVTGKG